MADTLADLIAASGRTYAELEAASGGRIRDVRWSQMASLPITSEWEPDPPQLAAMATALGQPEDVVRAAIAESVSVGNRG